MSGMREDDPQPDDVQPPYLPSNACRRITRCGRGPIPTSKGCKSMKLIFVIGSLAMTPNFIAIGQVKNTTAITDAKAEQEIRSVEDKRREALVRGDTTTLDQIFA